MIVVDACVFLVLGWRLWTFTPLLGFSRRVAFYYIVFRFRFCLGLTLSRDNYLRPPARLAIVTLLVQFRFRFLWPRIVQATLRLM